MTDVFATLDCRRDCTTFVVASAAAEFVGGVLTPVGVTVITGGFGFAASRDGGPLVTVLMVRWLLAIDAVEAVAPCVGNVRCTCVLCIVWFVDTDIPCPRELGRDMDDLELFLVPGGLAAPSTAGGTGPATFCCWFIGGLMITYDITAVVASSPCAFLIMQVYVPLPSVNILLDVIVTPSHNFIPSLYQAIEGSGYPMAVTCID